MYGQFLVIFALMLTGYGLRKAGVVNDEINRGLNKFIVYCSLPCFIFYKVAGIEMNGALLKEFMLAFALSTAVFLIFGLLVFAYFKLRRFPKEDACSAELVTVFPNNAFMGFPITNIFFGDIGLLFMLANNTAMNLTLFSYGVFVLRRNDAIKKFSLKNLTKCFLNPNILALAAGLLFYLLRIHVPDTANTYFAYLGGICTPMSLIFIGSTLVGTNIFSAVRDRLVLESVISKSLVSPLLTYVILGFLPLPAMMKAMIVFGACFPSAAMASVLVETEGKNSLLACEILAFSTAVSIVSIPIFVKLVNLIIL